jgi:hypothetical protein
VFDAKCFEIHRLKELKLRFRVPVRRAGIQKLGLGLRCALDARTSATLQHFCPGPLRTSCPPPHEGGADRSCGRGDVGAAVGATWALTFDVWTLTCDLRPSVFGCRRRALRSGRVRASRSGEVRASRSGEVRASRSGEVRALRSGESPGSSERESLGSSVAAVYAGSASAASSDPFPRAASSVPMPSGSWRLSSGSKQRRQRAS